MNYFSESSKRKLDTCHPDLRVLFAHVIQNYDCTIVCGFRGKKDQDTAFAEGNSTLRWPNSRHNRQPSWAVDVAPYEEKTGIDWKYDQALYFSGYVIGIADLLYRTGVISHRIKSGVDWNKDNNINDTKFKDPLHFEIIPNEKDT